MKCFLPVSIFTATLIAFSKGAVFQDEVKDLPGWDGPLPSRQYSGYIPVNDLRSRFLHYWFVESEGNPSEDPLVLWLNGGPGCSSLLGYLSELGPLHFDSDTPNATNPTLIRNPYNWARKANVIFLESPVGVGFSYSKLGTQDDPTNDTRTAAENLRFLENFFTAYPEYKRHDFYISGESYAGIYIPMLADLVRINNEKRITNINLKGLLVGNGCTGNAVGVCGHNAVRVKFMYEHGLISDRTFSGLVESCGDDLNGTSIECRRDLEKSMLEAGPVNIYDIYSPCVNDFLNVDFLENVVLPVPIDSDSLLRKVGLATCINAGVATEYLNTPEVRNALHVQSEEDIGKWKVCNQIGYQREVDSVLVLYPNLIRAYRTLIYNGDVDACVPYTDNEEWTSGLGFPLKEAWRPWLVDNQVAGYVTTYDVNGFTFATVKGSGHMVPQFRPAQAYAMFERFIDNKPF
eukprot:m.151064 g.151064  ORF g.151064 m.151064 type:complete len:461 (+) comp38566_c0_seq1:151-1533(+)